MNWFSEEGFVAATSQKKEIWGRSMSLPAFDRAISASAVASPVFPSRQSRQTAREFSRESARAAAEFCSWRRESEPNQRLEPTRLAGAVIATRLLRSTTRRISKFRLRARQRVAHH
jgi:hypothetical protein